MNSTEKSQAGAASGTQAYVPAALPSIDWTAWRHAGGPYYHARHVTTDGIELAVRAGGAPSVVGVAKPGDVRLKIFLADAPPAETFRISARGTAIEVREKAIGGGYLAQARFETEDAMMKVLGVPEGNTELAGGAAPRRRAVLDLTKPAPERDRSAAVPVPTETLKFPRAMFYASKRHGCLVLSRWLGRIPVQFHRHRKAPVLELAGGTTVLAYGTHLDTVDVFLNGKTFRMKQDPTYRSEHEDRFLVVFTPQEIGEIREWEPPVKRWKPPVLSEQQIEDRIAALSDARGGEYLDVCVETRFSPDPKADYLPWRGDVSGWPGWMEAKAVTVTPANTGGGGHAVVIDAPGLRKRAYPTIRLNNVWMVTGPWSGDSVCGYCDPTEYEEVRQYGQGLDAEADVTLPNEPSRIRTPQQASALHRLLRGGGDKYGPGLPHGVRVRWRDAAMQLNNALGAMSVFQGQADFNRNQEARCGEAAGRLEARVRRLYDRRAPAYADYDLEGWIAEQEDGKYVKPHDWTNRAKGLREDVITCRSRAESLEASVAKARRKYDEAVGRIETLEDEWADLVALLYPAAA